MLSKAGHNVNVCNVAKHKVFSSNFFLICYVNIVIILQFSKLVAINDIIYKAYLIKSHLTLKIQQNSKT